MKLSSNAAMWLIMLVLVLFIGSTCLSECRSNKLRWQLKKSEQNNLALRDSVRRIYNNFYAKYSLLVDNAKELETLNSSLAEELKTVKGKVITVTKPVIKIERDTTFITVTVDSFSTGNDSGIIAKFSDSVTYSPNNYRKLEGEVMIGKKDTTARLTKDEIGFSAVTGLRKDADGNYEIFFKSDYPGMKLLELDGAYIPKADLRKDFKAKRKLGIGLNIGPADPLLYDIKTKKLIFNDNFYRQIGVKIGININL